MKKLSKKFKAFGVKYGNWIACCAFAFVALSPN
jgi:hypothetical protein